MKEQKGSKEPIVFDKEAFISEGNKEFRKSIMQLQVYFYIKIYITIYSLCIFNMNNNFI